MNRLVSVPVPADAAATPAPPAESYACDPEPFDGNLDRCRGFVMQCELVFSQRPRSFPSDPTKINYIVSLLSGTIARVGAGVQCESAA